MPPLTSFSESLRRLGKLNSAFGTALQEPLNFFHRLGGKFPDGRAERRSLCAILERLQANTHATKGMLIMPDPDHEYYTVRASFGLNLDENALKMLVWEPRRYPWALAEAQKKGPLLLGAEDLRQHPEFVFEKKLGFKALCFQVLSDCTERILGAILLGNRLKEINFSHRDRQHLKAMRRSAEAELERVLFHHELRGVFVNMAKAFIAAIEAKDRYTRGHSERVTDYALKMACVLGWNQEELDVLHIAAILHDLGKIGVPESILAKPSQLSTEEFGIVKQHPEGGATIVSTVPQLLHAVSGIISHHERFDGQGYPFGLAGQDIPVLGRLIAVADAYDAMTSNRPYRESFTHQIAAESIQLAQNKQFDPEMVAAFTEACNRGIIP